jgi:uncharacterized cupin superfamily protein
MTETQIWTAAVDGDIQLEPYNLPPGGLVAGDPKPRIGSVTREEGGVRIMAGVFAADPGAIRNRVAATETIYVLEGRVRLELDTGEVLEVGEGELAVLPPGPEVTWTFLEPYKELFLVSEAIA